MNEATEHFLARAGGANREKHSARTVGPDQAQLAPGEDRRGTRDDVILSAQVRAQVGFEALQVGDARGRGFLIGATAGRTTLAGEGLQHDDGHSQLIAHLHPHVAAYDPSFAYEMAALIRGSYMIK